jgi:probable rRNA maturation factor
MPLFFNDTSASSQLKNKALLKKFITEQVQKSTKCTCRLQYVFVNDESLLAMNQNFLKHDTYTDIITFDLSESAQHIIGEIYISVDRVQANALKFKVNYAQELHRVMFHGALHLCGYLDKKAADKAQMQEMEQKWLKAYSKQSGINLDL